MWIQKPCLGLDFGVMLIISSKLVGLHLLGERWGPISIREKSKVSCMPLIPGPEPSSSSFPFIEHVHAPTKATIHKFKNLLLSYLSHEGLRVGLSSSQFFLKLKLLG